jgi:hypothetical protein
MTQFPGFTSSETFTQLPDSFLRMMNEIDDIAELKVTLFAIHRIEHIEGNFRGLSEAEFETESLGLSGMRFSAGWEKP